MVNKVGVVQSKGGRVVTFFQRRKICVLKFLIFVMVSPTVIQRVERRRRIQHTDAKLTAECQIKHTLAPTWGEHQLKPIGSVHLTQPHLLDQMLEGFKTKIRLQQIMAPATPRFVSRSSNSKSLWKKETGDKVTFLWAEKTVDLTKISLCHERCDPNHEFVKEVLQWSISVESSKAEIHCKVFKDSSDVLELAKVVRSKQGESTATPNRLASFSDHTWIENIFRFTSGIISMHKIETENQPADILTKPLSQDLFEKFRRIMMSNECNYMGSKEGVFKKANHWSSGSYIWIPLRHSHIA
jgi:hypothetical protein